MIRRLRVLPVLASFLALAIGSTLAVTAVSTPPSTAAPEPVSLRLGEAAFWSGPGGVAPDCGEACWSYTLEVLEPGFRLRVGIDRPLIGDVWRVELDEPSGATVASFSPGVDLYSSERSVVDPEVGTYVVRVTAEEVQDLRFRMRASLERDNGGLPSDHVLVPPNLRAMPPWDFSFTFPLTNGATGGPSQGVGLPGGLVSCHAEEVALYEARRCLRMSFGVGNVGLGPLELEVGPGQEFQDRPLIQRVRYADAGSISRDAGNAYYHHSHLHYHHDQAVGLDLLRVVDPETGAMEPAGEPHLKGFAHRDELLRDWDLFAPTWQKQGFGLLPGWADYYEWDRPGNFVDFGTNPDGLYVVRITADPHGFIQETDPTDNTAYSLIRVTGDEVEHLQSGMGADPWDRCRIPLPLGPEWEDSFELPEPRPEDCDAPDAG